MNVLPYTHYREENGMYNVYYYTKLTNQCKLLKVYKKKYYAIRLVEMCNKYGYSYIYSVEDYGYCKNAKLFGL